MARSDKPSHDPSAASATPDRPWFSGTFDPARDTLPMARDSLTGALELSQDFATWLQQWHMLGTESVGACCEALRTAQQDAEGARDYLQLMQLPVSLTQRQMSATLQQFSSAMIRLLDVQAQMAEHLRHHTGSLWQHMLPTPLSGPAMQPESNPLAPMSKMQAEWMALSQRWLESFNAAKGGSPH